MEENVCYRKADTYRQTLEAEQLKSTRVFDSFCISASNKLTEVISSKLGCDNTRVIKFSHKLSLDEESSKVSGNILFTVATMHDGDSKVFELPVDVSESEVKFPEDSVITSVLNSTTGVSKTAALKIKEEIENNIKRINEHEASKINSEANVIEKTAASVAAPADVLLPTLKINKDFLPAGIKVGDVLYIDAYMYRVVSGDDDKLNVEGSGVCWTLNKLVDTLKEDDVIINSQDKF